MIAQQLPATQASLYLSAPKDYNVLASVAVLALIAHLLPMVSGNRMASSSKPDFLTEERLLACLMFLSKLRKSGVTNMFELRLKFRQAFPDLTTNQAAEILAYWMHTFAAA